MLDKRKYRMLFSRKRRRRPGPKGPHKELIDAVVELKRRNPNWGCPRIAQQITLAFGVAIDKDAVRHILSVHYRPESDSGGPSWLTFLGHMKDSLWSMDLFRCESASLCTHWVLVVMDQYSRRIIGFGVHAGTVDGVALCRMFNRAIRWQLKMPKYLSTDNDPLYRFHQPLFWTATDLEAKLLDFQHYYNEHRTHAGRQGHPPVTGVNADHSLANLSCYRWQKHCRGLYQTPIAA